MSIRSILIALATALVAVPAMGQVRPNALDANPAVGSGGYNAPPRLPADSYLFNRGNYVVTGQVMQGRSFQGFVPYRPTDQFQGNLGTGTLYNFTRDSTDLRQATLAPLPPAAIAPLYTINARSIVSGRDVPPAGQSLRTTTTVNPFALPRYVDTNPLTTFSPGGATPSLSLNPLATYSRLSVEDQLALRESLILQQRATAAEAAAAPADRPSDFGLPAPAFPLPGDQPAPLNPYPSIRIHSLAPPTTPTTPAPPLPADQAALQGQSVGMQYRVAPIDGRVSTPAGVDVRSPAIERMPEAKPADQPPQPRPAPGEDLYSDMLYRYQELGIDQLRQPADERTGPPGPADQPPSRQPPAPPPTEQQPPPAPPGLSASPSVGPAVTELTPERVKEVLAELRIRQDAAEGRPSQAEMSKLPPPINLNITANSFASRRPSQANMAIAKAEDLNRNGRHYEALAELADAERCDPGNPLIELRIAHVYLGAGEFYSAALHLRRAMDIFPSVVSIKTDLAGFYPKDLLAQRIAALQQSAGARDDADLWLLLAYAQWAGGRDEDARRTAERLSRFADQDRQASQLAGLIQCPPTTQPRND